MWDLMDVRREVMTLVKRNQNKCDAAEAYEALHQMEVMNGTAGGAGGGRAHHAAAQVATHG
jgi:DNA polymerase epsilon subunit 1